MLIGRVYSASISLAEHGAPRTLNDLSPLPAQGVEQYTSFFKSAEDAALLRRQVSQCFERASLPQTPPEVRFPLVLQHDCCVTQHGCRVLADSPLHPMHQAMAASLQRLLSN